MKKISRICSAKRNAICFENALCAIPAVQMNKTGAETGKNSNESTWRHIYLTFILRTRVVYELIDSRRGA